MVSVRAWPQRVVGPFSSAAAAGAANASFRRAPRSSTPVTRRRNRLLLVRLLTATRSWAGRPVANVAHNLPRLRFPKAARLATAGEFRRVKEKGRSWPGKFIVLGVLTDAAESPARIGLITSRRMGGAVVRNRVRRLLRECVRPTRMLLAANCWVVLIARHTAARATLAELSTEWLRLARRASILPPAPPRPS